MLNDYKSETIQDIALKLVEEQLNKFQLENDSKEKTLLILGPKGVGKTTILNMYLNMMEHNNDNNDNNDDDKSFSPTLTLNYTYNRRSYTKESGLKQLLNIWEICSMDNEDFIRLPLKMHQHAIKLFNVIIMVDLSQSLFNVMKNVKMAYQNLKNCYSNNIEMAEGNNNNNLPFPVIIVGGKYDLFQKQNDNNLKMEMCKNLRSISNFMGAALLFYSNKMPKQIKLLCDIINHLGYGFPTYPCRSHQIDSKEPLCIWFGKDSWNSIDIKPIQSLDDIQISINNSSDNIDHMQIGDEELSEEPEPSSYSYSGKDSFFSSIKDEPFAEKEIDELYAIKKQEIDKILREISKRQANQMVTKTADN